MGNSDKIRKDELGMREAQFVQPGVQPECGQRPEEQQLLPTSRGFDRGRVMSAILLLGVLFAAYCASEVVFPTSNAKNRLIAAGMVFTGPVILTMEGMLSYHPWLGIGWLGMVFVLAYLLRPHPATATLALVGACLWFCAGVLMVCICTWGA